MTNNFSKAIAFFSLCVIISCSKKDAPPPAPNLAPIVTGVTVTGTAEVNKQLSATYNYSDAEGDVEALSSYKWYRANEATGVGETVILDSISKTYTLQPLDQGKFIRFGVTPKALTGMSPGKEIRSPFLGAVGEATSITFIYNGNSVTYGIINSSTTGKKWLDRNLGALNSPSAVDDFADYGDLFQWGRLGDGHQLITRTSTNDQDVTGASTTGTLATTDQPGNNMYILGVSAPYDWRIPQNPNLWQGGNGVNNPCPIGWHVPTREEWGAEGLGLLDDNYNKLKITRTGYRAPDFGALFSTTSSQGHYWTSTVDPTDPTNSIRARFTNGSGYSTAGVIRSAACAVRCIKN